MLHSLPKKKLVFAREEEMGSKNVLSLSSLAGFSEIQREKNNALTYDAKTVFGFIEGVSLTKRKKIWIPAQLVSRSYVEKHQQNISMRDKEREPILRWCTTTGLAAGKTQEAALLSGVLEIIERDAFMITYLNRLSPPRIDLNLLAQQSEKIFRVLSRFKRYVFEVTIVELPTDFPVRVFLSILVDPSGKGPHVTVGAAAGLHAEETIVKALTEALSIYRTTRKYIEKRGDKTTEPSSLDRTGRLLYWAKKKNTEDIAFLLHGPERDPNLSQRSPILSSREALQKIIEECTRKGYEMCYVDLTPEELARESWSVVATLIPELQPLHLLETVPCLGGVRLKSVPEALGYKGAGRLNEEPHPFP